MHGWCRKWNHISRQWFRYYFPFECIKSDEVLAMNFSLIFTRIRENDSIFRTFVVRSGSSFPYFESPEFKVKVRIILTSVGWSNTKKIEFHLLQSLDWGNSLLMPKKNRKIMESRSKMNFYDAQFSLHRIFFEQFT